MKKLTCPLCSQEAPYLIKVRGKGEAYLFRCSPCDDTIRKSTTLKPLTPLDVSKFRPKFITYMDYGAEPIIKDFKPLKGDINRH